MDHPKEWESEEQVIARCREVYPRLGWHFENGKDYKGFLTIDDFNVFCIILEYASPGLWKHVYHHHFHYRLASAPAPPWMAVISLHKLYSEEQLRSFRWVVFNEKQIPPEDELALCFWEPMKEEKYKEEPVKDPGFVYFLQGIDGGPIKIGHSIHPQVRMKQFSTPMKLRLIGQLIGTMRDETEIKKRFAHIRLNKEWFTVNKEILDFIKYNCMNLPQV